MDSAFDYFRYSDFLTPEENKNRLRLRTFLEREIAPTINDYVERAEFPEEYIPKLRDSGLFEYLLDKPFGKSDSLFKQGLIYAELARIDAGLATFAIV